MLSRRQFLAACAATPALALDPLKRADKPKILLSLAAYSFRASLDLKKPKQTLFEFIDFAADLPLDAVELTSYYWAEQMPAYAKKLADHAAKKKLAVSGVPVRSNFALKDDDKRKAEVRAVQEWLALAGDAGAKTLRVFAGKPDDDAKPEEARKRIAGSLEGCVTAAEKAGVVLAMENHDGLTASAADLLELLKPIKSKWVAVNLDTGNFKTPDPYKDIEAAAPYAAVCQIKTEVTPNGGKKEEADLAKIVNALRAAKFDGYAALEYEAADDPFTAVPKYVKELRKLMGE